MCVSKMEEESAGGLYHIHFESRWSEKIFQLSEWTAINIWTRGLDKHELHKHDVTTYFLTPIQGTFNFLVFFLIIMTVCTIESKV